MYALIQCPTSTHWNTFYLYLPKIESHTLQVDIWRRKTRKCQSRGMRMSEPPKKAFNAETPLVNPMILMKADVLLWTAPPLPTNSFHLKCLNHTRVLVPGLAIHLRWHENPFKIFFNWWTALGVPRTSQPSHKSAAGTDFLSQMQDVWMPLEWDFTGTKQLRHYVAS